MFPPPLRHIPALILISVMCGGIRGIFNAPAAMREFGLPDRIASSPTAQSPFMLCSARTTLIGTILFAFYMRGDYSAVDTILILVGGYLGIVDAWVCWKEGMRQKAVFWGLSCMAIAAWGWFGMTEVGLHTSLMVIIEDL